MSDIEEIKRHSDKGSHISLDIRVPDAKAAVRYDIDLSGNKVDPERFPLFLVWAKLLRESNVHSQQGTDESFSHRAEFMNCEKPLQSI